MTLAIIAAAGLLLGILISRIAAHGRRMRLKAELEHAEAEAEFLGYIAAGLQSHPFREGSPVVAKAEVYCEAMRCAARSRADACRQALAAKGLKA